MKLLTPAKANSKTAKNDSVNYVSAILHLAPSSLSGVGNVCPAASEGCKAACLNTAGRGQFNSVQLARINKTKKFYADRQSFMQQLFKDVESLERKAKLENKKAVVRLNGTSDIDWENVYYNFEIGKANLFEMFPDVQFYDYTKRPDRMMKYLGNKFAPNYHLTFSCSEVNELVSKRLLSIGAQVAIVFKNSLPETYWGFTVTDGDNTDLRFNDRNGVIIGLKAKGKAKKDNSGFVKQVA